jgi:hypothetical protein
MKKVLFGIVFLFAVSTQLVGMEEIVWAEQANDDEWQEQELQLSGRLSIKPGSEYISPIKFLCDNEDRLFDFSSLEQELIDALNNGCGLQFLQRHHGFTPTPTRISPVFEDDEEFQY